MMDFINKVRAFLEGKKTYLVAITGGVLGLLAACGVVVPEWVYYILGSLGLATVRSAIK